METPDNVAYLALGLLATGGLMLGFIGSLFARFRSLQQDMRVIEQLQADEDTA